MKKSDDFFIMSFLFSTFARKQSKDSVKGKNKELWYIMNWEKRG